MATSSNTPAAFALSEDFLKNFANTKLESFLQDYQNNTLIQMLTDFATGSGGQAQPGWYDHIFAGGGALSSAGALQKAWASFCSDLAGKLGGIQQTIDTLKSDLLNIQDLLQAGESAANITAQTFAADVQNVISSFTGTGSQPQPGG